MCNLFMRPEAFKEDEETEENNENNENNENEQGEKSMPPPTKVPRNRVELKANGHKLFIATNFGTYFWRGIIITFMSFLGLNQFNLIPGVEKINPPSTTSSPSSPSTSTSTVASPLNEEDCVEKVIQTLIDRKLLSSTGRRYISPNPKPRPSSATSTTPSTSRMKMPEEK